MTRRNETRQNDNNNKNKEQQQQQLQQKQQELQEYQALREQQEQEKQKQFTKAMGGDIKWPASQPARPPSSITASGVEYRAFVHCDKLVIAVVSTKI